MSKTSRTRRINRTRAVPDESIPTQVGIEQFCRRHGLTPRPGFRCAHILSGAKRCPEHASQIASSRFSCTPPMMDHLAMFGCSDRRVDALRPELPGLDESRPARRAQVVLTCQPYAARVGDLEQFGRELERWASGFGLRSQVLPGESWHAPGETILYAVWNEPTSMN